MYAVLSALSFLCLQMIVLSQNICNLQCPGRSIDLPWTVQKTATALSLLLSQQRAIATNIWQKIARLCGARGMGGKKALVKGREANT